MSAGGDVQRLAMGRGGSAHHCGLLAQARDFGAMAAILRMRAPTGTEHAGLPSLGLRKALVGRADQAGDQRHCVMCGRIRHLVPEGFHPPR